MDRNGILDNDKCTHDNKNEGKYVVYRNDIKYKKYRDIDPEKAVWDDDVRDDFMKKYTDDIEYRIEECKREKYTTLDLSYMDKDCFNKLFTHKNYTDIRDKLQHVFAKCSSIENIENRLNEIKNLQTLDLSCNKLKHLPILPESLEELIINDNDMNILDHPLPNLKRLNACNNNLKTINFSDDLERLHISNNPIVELPGLTKLYYLDVSTTNVKCLKLFPKLRYLDCRFTQIKKMPKMESLETLICTDSEMEDISDLDDLKILVMVRSKIKRIHFMKSLETLKYYLFDDITLSKQYKIGYVKKNKNNINEIFFK